MKRFLVVLFFLAAVGGAGAYWWLTRESPGKVLEDGLQSLLNLRTANVVTLDVASTDLAAGVTSGFTLIAQADVADVTHPRALGVLRLASKTTTEEDQTIDAVLEKDRLAVRPRYVKPEYRALAAELGGGATDVFLSVNRDAYLGHLGVPVIVAKGKDAAVRSAFAFILPALIPGDEVETAEEDGRTLVSTTFRFDRRSTQPFLINLFRAWKGSDPSVGEYGWIDRVTEGLAQGSFRLTIDTSTREVVRFAGRWPVVDDEGRELRLLNVTVEIEGAGGGTSIRMPEDAKDVTAMIIQQPKNVPLPTAGFRGGTSTIPATGTRETVIEPVRGRPQIDLFQQYSEELRKRKNLY